MQKSISFIASEMSARVFVTPLLLEPVTGSSD
jgi:hypothetical protein